MGTGNLQRRGKHWRVPRRSGSGVSRGHNAGVKWRRAGRERAGRLGHRAEGLPLRCGHLEKLRQEPTRRRTQVERAAETARAAGLCCREGTCPPNVPEPVSWGPRSVSGPPVTPLCKDTWLVRCSQDPGLKHHGGRSRPTAPAMQDLQDPQLARVQ
ncbi:hypothetical protein GN956_G5645 [Arapaima gigas]